MYQLALACLAAAQLSSEASPEDEDEDWHNQVHVQPLKVVGQSLCTCSHLKTNLCSQIRGHRNYRFQGTWQFFSPTALFAQTQATIDMERLPLRRCLLSCSSTVLFPCCQLMLQAEGCPPTLQAVGQCICARACAIAIHAHIKMRSKFKTTKCATCMHERSIVVVPAFQLASQREFEDKKAMQHPHTPQSACGGSRIRKTESKGGRPARH